MEKKEKIKTKLITIIFILPVLVVIILIVRHLTDPNLTHLNISSRENEFKPLVKEYTSLAEFYYDDFQKYDTEELVYLVPSQKDNAISWCITEKHKHSIELNNNQVDNYTKVKDSYYLDKNHLSYICVYNNCVSFCNDNGRASYVYSVNDKKPEYISSPDNPYNDIVVRKLANNWYWVCKRK
ncbi:MAG: hypothetical protein GXY08_01355 [Ruminococcus sp.]|nr:hypothetical protein [Ruminococcus sp.]